VRDDLPAFRLNYPVASDRVTVSDLLCHQSGLPRHDRARIQVIEPPLGDNEPAPASSSRSRNQPALVLGLESVAPSAVQGDVRSRFRHGHDIPALAATARRNAKCPVFAGI
jgi:CubicO group peptidase (beta-lactamase class C family)